MQPGREVDRDGRLPHPSFGVCYHDDHGPNVDHRPAGWQAVFRPGSEATMSRAGSAGWAWRQRRRRLPVCAAVRFAGQSCRQLDGRSSRQQFGLLVVCVSDPLLCRGCGRRPTLSRIRVVCCIVNILAGGLRCCAYGCCAVLLTCWPASMMAGGLRKGLPGSAAVRNVNKFKLYEIFIHQSARCG